MLEHYLITLRLNLRRDFGGREKLLFWVVHSSQFIRLVTLGTGNFEFYIVRYFGGYLYVVFVNELLMGIVRDLSCLSILNGYLDMPALIFV